MPQNCCCGGEDLGCCTDRAGSFPATLTMSITGTGDCNCLDQEITLTRITDTLYLSIGGFIMCDDAGRNISLSCSEGVWTITFEFCAFGVAEGEGGSVSSPALSCDPLHFLVEDLVLVNESPGCCDGTITIEITE